MGDIRVLDELTVSKIAAGEVVERPASVVKELIENSIDACSRRIRIEVENGGKSLIRVTDDGVGIRSDDVELAFERHATSKIRKIEDLDGLQTLGFRGEALPSIAAVSRVELRTRHESEPFGTYLRVEGGKIRERRKISWGSGTSITVRSLFYNVPARLKSMKSVATELRNIIDIVTSYAIINPEIKFELFHDGKLSLKTLGSGKMLDVIVTIFGKNVARELLGISYSSDDVTVEGYISKPAAEILGRTFVYVNRRFVRNDLVESAVRSGYGSLLPKNSRPFAVISLKMPPRDINVNVHPRKTEVHFYKPKAVEAAVEAAISAALRKSDLVPKITARVGGAAARAGGITATSMPEPRAAEARGVVTPKGTQTPLELDESVAAAQHEGEGVLDIQTFPLYQIYDSYIIAQSKDGDIFIIDQHAAAERIKFEKLLEEYQSRKLRSQELIRAYVPRLAPQQLCMLEENMEALRKMGFEIEKFGDDAVVIRAVPAILRVKEEEIMNVIERLVEHLKESAGKGDVGENELLRAIFSTAACVSSVKAGEKLSYSQMREIVEGLKKAKAPYTCPHGRPTMLKLSLKELEKKFKRA
ncbi:MAG: DNA mismatch repair ATPase MutL [Candidatus Alkanophagales archaeon MCA70_species_1]|nr:DNA mismatch repair ATPase MutL [Candidatus Alkanophaga volatiphilum]